MGEWAKALDFFGQALFLRQQVDDRGGEAYILNNMRVVFGGMGKREDGLQLVEQAQALFEAIRSPNAQISARLVAQMREILNQSEYPH